MSVIDPRLRPSPLAERSAGAAEPCDAHDVYVAVCSDLSTAKAAIRIIGETGLDLGRHGVVCRVGPFDGEANKPFELGDRTRFWEACSELWGGPGDLPLGGLMLTIPRVGVLLIGGRLAGVMVTSVRSSSPASVGACGLGALGAALAGMGLSDDELLLCREALEVGAILVVGDGPGGEAARGGLLRQAGEHRASVSTAAGRADHPSYLPPLSTDRAPLDRASRSRDAILQEPR